MFVPLLKELNADYNVSGVLANQVHRKQRGATPNNNRICSVKTISDGSRWRAGVEAISNCVCASVSRYNRAARIRVNGSQRNIRRANRLRNERKRLKLLGIVKSSKNISRHHNPPKYPSL